MCGIFGLVLCSKSTITPRAIQGVINRLFLDSESRGKEAAGAALILPSSIKVLKSPMPASALIKTTAYRALLNELTAVHTQGTGMGLAILGHSRLVTNGSALLHHNNQPVIKMDLLALHNGIVVNEDEIWSALTDQRREYEVDTESILGICLEQENQGKNITDAIRSVFSTIKGAASVALFSNKLNSICLATNNGSLYYRYLPKEQVLVFASEKFILDRVNAVSGENKTLTVGLEAGQAMWIDIASLQCDAFNLLNLKHTKLPIPLALPTARKIEDIRVISSGSELRQAHCFVPTQDIYKKHEAHFAAIREHRDLLRRCTRCILPETMPFIDFDQTGVCNFCHHHKSIKYLGQAALASELDRTGIDDTTPCLVTVSGGRDSCYGLHYLRQTMKVKVVAYTYDWGLITDLARRNISRICGELGIEHILVSADIRRKRENVRKNVQAWLKRPALGMIPLFMAGDKQFFPIAEQVKNRMGIKRTVLCENLFERTTFKSGFCGIKPQRDRQDTHSIGIADKLRMATYYSAQMLSNPTYFNSSLFDTALAFIAYYIYPHNFLWLFHYIPWNENEIVDTLIAKYGWETAPDTIATWRIGDATAAFYNYIYFAFAGFTENDTFRSNQVREGKLARQAALDLVKQENMPRWESLAWYCNTLCLDFDAVLSRINAAAASEIARAI